MEVNKMEEKLTKIFERVEEDIPSLWSLTFEDRLSTCDMLVSITKHMASSRLMVDGFIRNRKKKDEWFKGVISELENMVFYKGFLYTDTRIEYFGCLGELQLLMTKEKLRRLILFQKFDHVLK